MLNHDPHQRPTCAMLLTSDLLPRDVEMDESGFRQALHAALANPQSREYKAAVGAMFDQATTVVQASIRCSVLSG